MTRSQIAGVFVAGVAAGAALATGLGGDWLDKLTTVLLFGAYITVLWVLRVHLLSQLLAERKRAESAEQQLVLFMQMLENSNKN